MKQRLTAFLLTLTSLLLFQHSFAQPANEVVRYYEYEGDNGSSSESFWDIYLKADGGLVAVGVTNIAQRGPHGMYVCNMDRNGEKLWEHHYSFDQFPTQEIAYSVIETDDGGFALGGRTGPAGGQHDYFSVIRLDPDGEIIWWNRYNERGGNFGNCYALIETKGGGFLAVGDAPQDRNAYPGLQYAVMIDNAGNVVWEHYTNEDQSGQFNAVREVADDGYVIAGSSRSNTQIIKLNQNGELIWNRRYEYGFYSMVSCIGGGFALSAITGDGWVIQRVDNDGNNVWHSLKEFDAERPWWNQGCIAQLPDGGFAFVGTSDRNDPTILRTDSQGNELWCRIDHYGHPRGGSGEYYRSVIIAPDRSIVVAGVALNETRADTSWDALIVKLEPDIGTPRIIEALPENRYLQILTGFNREFKVYAVDRQEDQIHYLWKMDDQEIGDDSSVVVRFDDRGFHEVACFVSDQNPGDSVFWEVEVSDLFISAFTPDSLELNRRRGTSIDFSIDRVSRIDGEDPQYFWTLTNLSDGATDTLGFEDEQTIDFPWSGEYLVEGRAWRGGTSDAIYWTVSVRGAILAFVPLSESIEVFADSLVHFEVVPSLPDDPDLSILWLVDGNLVLENEPVMEYRFSYLENFSDFVTLIVSDSNGGDTLIWTVDVLEPNGEHSSADLPLASALLSITPNPFNSTTLIRYSLSSTSRVKLTFLDINGRVVAEPLNEQQLTGEYSIVFDGANLSAGIYFLQLEVGTMNKSTKLVLIK